LTQHLPSDGVLTLKALQAAVSRRDIQTVLVVFPDIYGRLLGKRLTAQFFLDHAAEGGTHVCDYLLACDIEMDPVPGYKFTSWEKGYGDMHAIPDLSTMRKIEWLPGTAMVLCDLHTPSHAPAGPAPRNILKKQLDKAKEMGFAVKGGTELEFYVFNESYQSAREKGYRGLTTAASYIEDYHILQGTREDGLLSAIRNSLTRSGVPVEGTKGEWGPGQQELNLIYCDALEQADRAVICKHAAKEIADLQGKAVTFMAKWDEKLAGSGMHMHVSLWNAQNRSEFGDAAPSGGDTFRWFLAGLLEHTAELTALFAPYISSYKRFQSGSFAPTGIAWSDDNRTAGYRVVGSGPSLRIECRIPGADANPYLTYAAVLAAGLDGISSKREPPAKFEGDIYQAEKLPRLHGNLRDACDAFGGSAWVRSMFGDDIVDHYVHFMRTEQRKFDEVVTDWEKARFFERI
jgi:glutamine synthetase